MKWTNVFVAIAILSLIAALSVFSSVKADSFSIPPATIYGTTINVSVSYPDFYFGDPSNISLAIAVNFYNESVSAVNITEIHVKLYPSNVNLTQKGLSQPYAEAYWLTTDCYPEYWNKSSIPPPYKIERQSPEVSTGAWNKQLTLSYQEVLHYTVQAKLYVQVTLCFLNASGKPIWRIGENPFESGYHWTLSTAEGEAPYVTIYSKPCEQFWLYKPENLALIVGLTALVLIVIVVKFRKRKNKVETPQQYG